MVSIENIRITYHPLGIIIDIADILLCPQQRRTDIIDNAMLRYLLSRLQINVLGRVLLFFRFLLYLLPLRIVATNVGCSRNFSLYYGVIYILVLTLTAIFISWCSDFQWPPIWSRVWAKLLFAKSIIVWSEVFLFYCGFGQ